MSHPPICDLLQWDSDFFGYPVARLRPGPVDANALTQAFNWCHTRNVRCLYYLAPANIASSLLAAQAAGMQFVDVRLTLSRTLTPEAHWDVLETISPAADVDRTALAALAPSLARVSRFTADPRFGTEAAVRLYERWLAKDADAVWVARMSEGVGGCVSCNVTSNSTGVINLLVVAEAHRGQGLGKALCAAGLRWFVHQGCTQARVVTQGHNVASQRIYQQNGFVTQTVEIWFHKWFDRP